MEQEMGAKGAGKKGFGIVPGATFVLAYLGARVFLKMDGLSDGARILAALLPVAPFVWMLWQIVRGVREMDELEQRIQLEALALAFPLTLILLMTLGLLEIAVSLPPEDLGYRHVWAMLPIFYLLGITLARKKYK